MCILKQNKIKTLTQLILRWTLVKNITVKKTDHCTMECLLAELKLIKNDFIGSPIF